jgi:hypothetical protein
MTFTHVDRELAALAAAFPDRTMTRPELRHAIRDERKRLFRKSRRMRLAQKHAFLSLI